MVFFLGLMLDKHNRKYPIRLCVAETMAQLFLVYLVFNHEWFQNCWPGDKGSFVISLDKLDFPVVQRVKNLPAMQETWV